MINYANLSTSRPTIDYDTSSLTNGGYELKFALDFENPNFQEVINRCKKYNWPYKIVDGVGRQKHVWIKGWIKEKFSSLTHILRRCWAPPKIVPPQNIG